MVLEICRGFKLMEPRPLYLQVRAQFDLFGTSLHQSIFEKIKYRVSTPIIPAQCAPYQLVFKYLTLRNP
jgi:hypothetical protein